MLSRTELCNEWRLVRCHPIVWVAMAGVVVFSVLLAQGSHSEPGITASEALLRLNLFVPALMLPFAAGALGPVAYLREIEWDMADIVGSYPMTARQWLAARLGNLVLLLFATCAMAQAAIVAVLAPDYPGAWSTLAAQSLIWLVVLHLPACLLWASVMAWLANQRAHSGLLYFGAGIGWLGYLGISTLTGTPLIAGSYSAWPPLTQAMLVLDPYAAAALLNPIPDQGPLQWRWLDVGLGRLVWIGVSLLLLRVIASMPAHSRRYEPESRIRAKQSASRAERRSSHIGIHLRYLLCDQVFLLLVLGWFALLLPEVFGGMDNAEPLARIAPDSRDALNRVVWDVLPLAGALLLAYTADRLCRLYQTTRMHELYGATPHRPLALITTQFASLGVVALGSLVLTGIAVALAQVLVGSTIDPLEYLVQLGLSLPPLVLFAALFVAVHGLVRSRLFANLACILLLALGLTSLARLLGLHHPLWKPLATPLSPPDHFWGFANGVEGHFAFLGFWAAIALAALLLAAARSHRTQSTPQVRALQTLRHPASLGAAALLALAVWQGASIDRTLQAEGALTTPDEKVRLRADYERGYSAWNAIAQPDVEAITARVAFFPSEHRVTVRAALRLINHSDQPIAEVLVGDRPEVRDGVTTLEGAAVVRRDARLGQTVFRLARPMQRGERRELAFSGSISRSGLQAATFPLVLDDRFSSVPASEVLPVVGFKRELTLRDPVNRRKQGLPELGLTEPSKLAPPPSGSLARDRVLADTLISTAAGSYAIGQGRLVRRWEAGGRAYFHYRTDRPIRNVVAFLSVRGEPQEWPAGPVTIRTHTPQPLAADDVNVLAMRDTLALLGSEVAPYPGTDLHLVAIPEIGPSGYALPQIVEISHRLAIRARPQAGAGFNQAYRRAAHETAHQWFGHLLGHGLAEERTFLIESLAKYVELVVIERRFGKPASAALVDFERDRYRHARLDPDRPIASLIDADETEDMYSRATLAFACLRRQVGDAPILAALKATADDMRVNDRPATSLGFLRALKAEVASTKIGIVDALFLGSRPIQTVERELGCDGNR